MPELTSVPELLRQAQLLQAENEALRAEIERLRAELDVANNRLAGFDAACAAIEKLNEEEAEACRQTAEYWDRRESRRDYAENLCDCGMGDATMPDLHDKTCAVHRG